MSDSPLSMNLYAEDWLKRPLIKVSEFIKDGTHGTHERVNIGVPLLSAKNITSYGSITIDEEDSRISNDDYQKIHSKYEIQKNDLLITVVGTLGRRALADGVHKFSIQRSVGVVRCDTTKIFPEFLYHFTGSDYFQNQLTLRSNATAQAGVYLGELAKIDIAIPPLPEQQKIATILTSVDTVIEKTRAQIDKLKHLKIGMMQQLLTQGIGHTEFKDTPVGRIPKAWKVVPLEELCSKVSVGIATSTTHAYCSSDVGVPLLRNQNILQSGISGADILYISQEFSKENTSKKIRTGDVLTVRTGYPGISAVVPKEFDNCHSFTTLISRPKSDALNSHYLSLLINSDYGKSFVIGGQAGGAQQNLNATTLKYLPVILPALAEQDAIYQIVNSVSDKIFLVEKRLAEINLIKKALMQVLLTGRNRVLAPLNPLY